MNPEILDKVLACKQLPSLPAVAMRVLELSGQENVSFKEIADTITNDQGLSSKVLRTVNSSFYALRKPCASINQSIVMLGLSAVKTLALGFSLVGSIAKTQNPDFDYQSYWRRSLYTGVAAKCVAGAARIGHDEEAFLGGLLQDVGMIALAQALGSDYAATMSEAGPDHNNLAKLEMSLYDTTHSDIGALLAGRWKLPPELVMPIKFHHRPQAAPTEHVKLCMAVGLGNIIADVLSAQDASVALKKYYAKAQEWFNLTEGQADEILKSATQGANDMARLLSVDTGKSKVNVDELKDKATEKLLSIKTPILEGGVGDEQDEVTGLPGRIAFNRNLVTAFEQTQAGGGPTSIALLAIDGLADIRSGDGEHIADAVLAHVGKVLHAQFEQAGGLVCRFDEHRFAAMVANTDRLTITRLVEEARKSIGAGPVKIAPPGLKGQEMRLTLSGGAACYEPASFEKFPDPESLVEITERALAAAQKAGRDAMRVFVPKSAAA